VIPARQRCEPRRMEEALSESRAMCSRASLDIYAYVALI
jgi:hypothetical protein